jgi:hypothetical protein
MKTTLYFPLLLCSILFFSCSKSSSNPQTPPPTPKTEIDLWVGASSYVFNYISKGKSETNIVSFMQNQSTSNANLSGSIVVSGQGFSLALANPVFNLPPPQNMAISVTFSPTSTGTFTGTVYINHNATNMNTPTTIAISGSAQ